MAKPNLSVLPPTTLEEIFSHLANLDDSQFQKLSQAIESSEGFEAEKERCERLGAEIGVAPEIVGYILSALAYVYQRLSRDNLSSNDVLPIVQSFIEDFDEKTLQPADRSRLVSRVSALVTPKKSLDEARKFARLRNGFLPNSRSLSTMVDLRPSYDAEHSEIVGLVPVVQVRITTDSDDPSKKYFVFQTDERRLKAMRQALEEAEKKLSVLSSSGRFEGLLQMRDTKDGD